MAASRADIQAGAAYVRLYVKGQELTQGMKDAMGLLKGFGSKVLALRSIVSSLGLHQVSGFVDRVRGSVDQLGRSLVKLGVASSVPLGLSVKQFADFDDAMREVRAVSEGTDEQFATLTETAKRLGATTSFSAKQVASLMTELGRAGFSPDQVNEMTEAVLDLSRASSTDATVASGIMAASIRQFGLEAKDAARVADALALAANKSFSSVESLGEALSYAGPVTRDLGYSIEQTLAILGGLGNVGIQGSEAGTALRRLAIIGSAEAKKLQEIFGVAFLDASGKSRNLVDALSDVNDATANLGDAARAAKFNEAFGLLGITAASAIGKTVGDIRSLNTALDTAGGSAKKAAQDMDAGVGGALRKMLKAAESITLALGEALEPTVKSIAETITGFAQRIQKFVDENKEFVNTVAKVVIALAGMGAAMVVIGAALAPVAAVFSFLGSIASIAAPLISVFALLTTLAGGVGPLIAFVGSVVSAIGSVVTFGGVLGAIGTVAGFVLPFMIKIGVVVAAVSAAMLAAVAAVGAAAVAFWKLADPLTALGPLFRVAINTVQNVVKALSKGDMQGIGTAIIGGIRDAILAGTKAIIDMVKSTLTNVIDLITGTESSVTSIAGRIAAGVKQAFQAIWPALRLSFQAFAAFADDVFNQLPQLAGYAAGRIVRAIISGMIKLQMWINNTMGRMITDLLKALAGLGPKILKGIFTGNIKSVGTEIAKAMQASVMANVGFASGLMAMEAPDFKLSNKTVAAYEKIGEDLKKSAGTTDTAAAAGSAKQTSTANPVKTFFDGLATSGKQAEVDPTTLEKYRTRLQELIDTFSGGKLTPEQFTKGLKDAKREILGIELSPLEEYQELVLLLSQAFSQEHISQEDFSNTLKDAKSEILGLDVSPLEQFHERIGLLNESLRRGWISFETWVTSVKDAKQQILGLEDTSTPLDKFLDRMKQIEDMRGVLTPEEFHAQSDKATKDFLGLDPSAIETFTDRVNQLQAAFAAGKLNPTDFFAAIKDAQDKYLGLAEDPIDSYLKRIESLRIALAKGIISPEQFNKAAEQAVPDDIKRIAEENKTPLEKFQEDMAKLEEKRGFLGEELFGRESQRLTNQLLEDSGVDVESLTGKNRQLETAGTFSAAAAAGMGIGSEVDKSYEELVKANTILASIDDGVKRRPKFR